MSIYCRFLSTQKRSNRLSCPNESYRVIRLSYILHIRFENVTLQITSFTSILGIGWK